MALWKFETDLRIIRRNARNFGCSLAKFCAHHELARRVVAEIGQIEGIAPMLAGLLGQLGYKPPVARQHRSKAWLAQRALQPSLRPNASSKLMLSRRGVLLGPGRQRPDRFLATGVESRHCYDLRSGNAPTKPPGNRTIDPICSHSR